MKNTFLVLTAMFIFLFSCSSEMTFEEQIINDLKTKLPTGKCEGYPKGTNIANIVIGDIVEIGTDGMTDVSYELDYEIDGLKEHRSSSMLYIKSGSKYILAVMGCDSDFANY